MSTTNTTRYPKHTAASLSAAQQAKNITLGALNTYDARLKDWVEDLVLTIPEEQFLDQSKTQFIEKFNYNNWKTGLGAIGANDVVPADPSKDGKPVLIMAIKSYDLNDASVAKYSYQIIDMTKLVDIYVGKSWLGAKDDGTNDGDSGIEIKVEDGAVGTADEGKKVIKGAIKLHVADKTTDPSNPEADNLAKIADDGTLYVPSPADFDPSDLEDRLDDLEGIVGHAEDIPESSLGAGDGEEAFGLAKDMKDAKAQIGNYTEYNTPGDPTSGVKTAATGMAKDIEDLIAADKNIPNDTDWDALFA